MHYFINLSHNNFDGYVSSFLLKEVLHGIHGKDIKFSQFNVEYSDIKSTILSFSKFNPADAVTLYITDLNLNKDSFDALAEVSEHIGITHYMAHHRSNKVDLSYYTDPTGDYPIDFRTVTKQGLSTSRIIYDHFKPDGSNPATRNYPLFKYKTLVKYVNAWDITAFTDHVNFSRGQLFNDFFKELMAMFKFLPKAHSTVLVNIFFQNINNNVFDTDKLSASTIDGILRQRLPSAFMDIFWDDPQRVEVSSKISSRMNTLGFKQSISLLVAYILTLSPFNMTEIKLDNDEKVRVFFPLMPNLPMSVVHHLMYTLNYADIAIIVNSDNKVELRQAAERALVALNEVALEYNGGGGTSSAGFYGKNLDKDRLISSLQRHYLKGKDV